MNIAKIHLSNIKYNNLQQPSRLAKHSSIAIQKYSFQIQTNLSSADIAFCGNFQKITKPYSSLLSSEKSSNKPDDYLEKPQEHSKEAIEQSKKEQQFDDEKIKNLTKDEKTNFFRFNLFSSGFLKLNETERLILLEKFEKYGLRLDLFSKKNIFRSDDNMNFFQMICYDPSNIELTKKYIETFDKYAKIKPEEISSKMVSSIIFPSDAKNVLQAIEQIKDDAFKARMLECYSCRIKELNSTKQMRLAQEFLKISEKYMYPTPKVTSQQKEAINEKFGKYAGSIIRNFENILTKDELLNLAHHASKSEEMFEYCTKNIDYIVLLVNSGAIIQDPSLDSEIFKMFVENAKTFLKDDINERDIEAIIKYIGIYDSINSILRFFPKIDKIINDIAQNGIPQDIFDSLDELQEMLNALFNLSEDYKINLISLELFENKIIKITQDLKNNVLDNEALIQQLQELKSLVYSKYNKSVTQKDIACLNKITNAQTPQDKELQFIRFENSDVFEQISLNGTPLSKLMEDDANTNIVLEFLNSEKPTITQPAYMSTSVYPYSAKFARLKRIKWILKADKNAKGRYITDIKNIFTFDGKTDAMFKDKPKYKRSEAEFLFAPNSTIKIESAKAINNYGEIQYEIRGIINHKEK